MTVVEPPTVLTGHIGWVRSVAWATGGDGRLLLATGSYDGTVRVWTVGVPAPRPRVPARIDPAGAPLRTAAAGLVLLGAAGRGLPCPCSRA
ncbi:MULTISPECIES: WD40 repeat domain-containing protein [Protofrankia]|uniref:WD40 repeat-containing protein n=1 Tax=Candidatus Protofrankia datiscae TaxID=2716812 RepID=F8B3Y2_9ACTN|nr:MULTISPECIES: WD40 repeat domain-containing protein [Protofrankia]AEH09994.1 WD40 repeat-containing protein [Candidatus Protofrankia datiscae]